MQTDGVSEEKTLVSGASREKAGGATHENADGAVRENAESTMHENADDTACENANGTIRENADGATCEKSDVPPRRVLIAGAGSYIGTSFARWAGEHYHGRIETREISMHGDAWRKEDFSEYDAVLHVAGIAHADTGSVTEEQKRAYYDVNTRLAIDSAKKAKGDCVPQFILMSSMIVYGESGGYGKRRVITRETRPRPASVYGDSKWRADKGVRALRAEDFHVAVVRSPMVYGSRCKGNYPMLERMAKKLPVFPDVKNERSMIYIDNLCEFLCRLVLDGRCGVFFPQNRDLVCTADLVRWIAEEGGHRIAVTRVLNPAVLIASRMPQRGALGKVKGLADKAFGNMAYEPSMSRYAWADYQIAGTRESVRQMERDEETVCQSAGAGESAHKKEIAVKKHPASSRETEKTASAPLEVGLGREVGKCARKKIGSDKTQNKGRIQNKDNEGSKKTRKRREDRIDPDMVPGMVSIITPCYNAEKYLSQTIDSVLAQTYSNWEMLIIDDGSLDRSFEIASEYEKKDKRIRLYRQENAGSAAARNNGIKRASGQYIALLDADDLWDPEFLEKQVAFMKEKGAECVLCSYRRIDEQSREILRPTRARKVVTVRDMMRKDYFGCLTGLYDRSRHGKVFLREELKSLLDDYAYWLDVVRLSGRAYGNQEVLASYRVLSNSATGNKAGLIRKHYLFNRDFLGIGPVHNMWNLAVWGAAGIRDFVLPGIIPCRKGD